MNLISIDVGIKNLALCVFNVENKDNYKLLDWTVANLCKEISIKCKCGKNANYKFENQFSCKKHIKDTKIPIIHTELELKKLKKMKIVDIRELLQSKNIEFDKKQSKILLLEYLQNYLEKTYFMPFSNKVNTNDLTLIEIGINLKEKLDELYNDIKIDTVIIENQISPIANRMTTLQGMIAQYFIMKNVPDIKFVSAKNKLKHFENNEEKSSYSERKKLSIKVCRNIIVAHPNICNNHLEIFDKSNKKDDFADSFLQGLVYLADLNIINYQL